jgi:hypothetical protein
MGLGFTPTVDSTDRFSIYKSGTNWILRVSSSAAGTYGYRTIPVSACGQDFDWAWYGYENTYSKGDRFGGVSTNNNAAVLRDMAYRNAGSGSLVYLSGSSNIAWDLHGGPAAPLCWIEGFDPFDSNGHLTMSASTTAPCGD